MNNNVYTYLIESNILFNKQFRFRAKHSTEHAITELVDAILNGFSEEKYILGVLIDLSKAFDTVNHQILLSTLISKVSKVKAEVDLGVIFQKENNVISKLVNK